LAPTPNYLDNTGKINGIARLKRPVRLDRSSNVLRAKNEFEDDIVRYNNPTLPAEFCYKQQ